ncbi:MAG TPA: DNA primase [Acidobacteriota bacterium]|nr:DNA primase [Acidobacteriota bacterium]
MAWPRSFIDEVRRSADPVRLIGEVVELKKRGTRWVGLCPFHQEKTPSFTVNDEGLWHCFGCGEGGDLFKFVQQHEGIDFVEAVRSLAELGGVAIPESSGGPRRQGPKVDRERILQALRAAGEFYVAELESERGTAARAYLTERGFEGTVAAQFGLGFAPGGWGTLQTALEKRGFTITELELAGLVRKRADGSGVYDLLRDRVVFPIRDSRGRPIAFSGRVLGAGEPKYLNSPETPVFNKSRTLYGLREARDGIRHTGFVMLVEGQLDLLACVKQGFTNVVAPLGTAFTAEHARLLSSHTGKAVIAFDGDNAGRAAAERTVGVFLPAGFQVTVVQLPSGQDPDSFLNDHGADGLSEALRQSFPALSFLVARAAERGDLRSPQGKAQALASLLGFVLEVEDRVERAEWMGRIGDALEISRHLVERSFAELRQRSRRRSAGPSDDRPVAAPSAAAQLSEVPVAERDLTRALLLNPDWLSELQPIYGDGITDPRVEALLAALAAADVMPDRVEDLLAGCEVDGAAQLLTRLVLEGGDDPGRAYAVSCAEAIRRGAVSRELRSLQAQIEAMQQAGEGEIDALDSRKMALVRELETLKPVTTDRRS